VRRFFEDRGVLEVETPLLCEAGAVDEHLDPVPVDLHSGGPLGPVRRRYLATSPEHSMKRLLVGGSGPIYQVTRAFRDGERGRLHNPEFTILEWYRPGWDHLRLMDEVEELIRGVFLEAEGGAPEDLRREAARPFERVAYREAFLRALGVDPFRSTVGDLTQAARGQGIAASSAPREEDRDGILNLLLAAAVEKQLGYGRPAFLMDYPPSQAALARVKEGEPPVAERFELYVRGIELANGYHELLDPLEQERRFADANEKRRAAGKAELPMDRRFLEALRAGMPSCAGVAMGLDRVLMLAVGGSSIDDVLTFPIDRA